MKCTLFVLQIRLLQQQHTWAAGVTSSSNDVMQGARNGSSKRLGRSGANDDTQMKAKIGEDMSIG